MPLAAAAPPATPKIDFDGAIKPILAARCVSCHNTVQAQGGLDLTKRSSALAVLSPGKPEQSVLLARVEGHGGKPRMPQGFAPLSSAQIALLRVWIAAGAIWPDASTTKPTPWAYQPLVRPLEPPVDTSGIDAFVQAKLIKAGLSPSPEADRTTLIRRVTLDLTGLAPTPAEVDTFVADRRPGAYERVVDRLLASPHFGERMALPWLDAARYADSNGFQQDGDTYQWVWRDWVVRAFNDNKPFDQFTIEQLAGDLLPNPTLDQQIATGFNRCHLLNGEGGAIAEEQRNVILFDRVDVTATTWLGATLACAQCHDHKFDPLLQKDYYRFLAFFNNVPETGVPPGGGQYRIAEPSVAVGSAEQRLRLARLEQMVGDSAAALSRAQSAAGPATNLAAIKRSVWKMSPTFAGGSFDDAFDRAFAPETAADDADWAEHAEYKDGAVQPLTPGDNAAVYLSRLFTVASDTPVELRFGSDDGVKVWLDGKLIVANKTTRAALADQEKVSVTLTAGSHRLLLKIVNGGGIAGFYFNLAAPESPALAAARAANASAVKERDTLLATLPRVMVMSDAKPRKTFVLDRGNYEAPRDEVTAGTPSSLPPMTSAMPTNRLGLARWLVSPNNPLTARVQVNRLWQLFFGVGLVKTSENFGIQAEAPSHPELLDYLASEFARDWNVKRIVRLIVTSGTYKQSSRVTADLLRRDPSNRLLGRGARFRLPSMILRDVALGSSGLMNGNVGGKPVYPYQPRGIWDGLSITKERDFTYPQSTGPDLYRRSLYTFWRRTVAPGNMFDASSRQTCRVRTSITSTPLHALTTLNDVTWVEAGRALAQRVMLEAGADPNARLAEAFRRVCARRPSADELTILRRSYDRARASFAADPKAADAYLKVGDSTRSAKLNPIEHAAYASVCLAIYNLDEALTRE